MKAILLIFLFFGIYKADYKGIDVSTWQNTIDWGKVAKEKHFAIIRAGYGVNGAIDDYWEKNYKAAKAAGVKVGAYWYSYANSVTDAKNEAKGFLKALKGKQLEWPVYYDIEEASIFNAKIHNDIAEAFCDVMEASKYFCGIYSGAWNLNHNFNDRVKQRFSIWVAHWGVSQPGYNREYGIWQTGSGAVSGVSGACDLDIGKINFEPTIKNGHFNGY